MNQAPLWAPFHRRDEMTKTVQASRRITYPGAFDKTIKVAIALTVVMVAFYSALLVAIFHQRF